MSQGAALAVRPSDYSDTAAASSALIGIAAGTEGKLVAAPHQWQSRR